MPDTNHIMNLQAASENISDSNDFDYDSIDALINGLNDQDTILEML